MAYVDCVRCHQRHLAFWDAPRADLAYVFDGSEWVELPSGDARRHSALCAVCVEREVV